MNLHVVIVTGIQNILIVIKREVIKIAKLYWRYGTMGSSKTAQALMTKFNYEEKNYKVMLFKPSIDNRDGEYIVKSRIGLESVANIINQDTNIIMWWGNVNSIPDCIIVDEAQFLTTLQVENFKFISSFIPVFCYGLRSDFTSHMFEGSKRLFEIADSISELKSICHCGNKAIINARYNEDGIIYDGDQVDIGGNEKYIGLCYDCWENGRLK